MTRILYIFYLFTITYFLCNSMILPKYKNFMNRKHEYNKLMNLINSNEKRPILINGKKTCFKKDFCKTFCEINNITFREYQFDQFILELPYKKYKNYIIYVSNFFIDYGRVFNEYEKYILSNLIQTNNLIIFESENINIDEYVSDSLFLKNMKKIEFPEITKKYIEDYIYYVISFHKYNYSMNLLNWRSYDIDNLDIEKINLLLFTLNDMFNQYYSLRKIHNNVNNIIESIVESDYFMYNKLEI